MQYENPLACKQIRFARMLFHLRDLGFRTKRILLLANKSTSRECYLTCLSLVWFCLLVAARFFLLAWLCVLAFACQFSLSCFCLLALFAWFCLIALVCLFLLVCMLVSLLACLLTYLLAIACFLLLACFCLLAFACFQVCFQFEMLQNILASFAVGCLICCANRV